LQYDNKDREAQIGALNAQLAQQERSAGTGLLWLLVMASLVFICGLFGVADL
jgi:hypothetical protein